MGIFRGLFSYCIKRIYGYWRTFCGHGDGQCVKFNTIHVDVVEVLLLEIIQNQRDNFFTI